MIRCPNCHLSHPEGVVTCDCGYDLKAYAEQLKAQPRERNSVSQAYQFASYLIVFLQGMGVLSILAGLVYAVILSGQETSLLLIVAVFLGGILGSIPYFAFSEGLEILLRINKRQDSVLHALDRIEKKIEKP